MPNIITCSYKRKRDAGESEKMYDYRSRGDRDQGKEGGRGKEEKDLID